MHHRMAPVSPDEAALVARSPIESAQDRLHSVLLRRVIANASASPEGRHTAASARDRLEQLVRTSTDLKSVEDRMQVIETRMLPLLGQFGLWREDRQEYRALLSVRAGLLGPMQAAREHNEAFLLQHRGLLGRAVQY
jgi:hypothetical protein